MRIVGQRATTVVMNKTVTPRWGITPGPVLAFVTLIVFFTHVDPARAASGDRQGWQPGITIFTAGLPEERAAEAVTESQGFQDGESVGLPWSVGGGLELTSPPLAGSDFECAVKLRTSPPQSSNCPDVTAPVVGSRESVAIELKTAAGEALALPVMRTDAYANLPQTS